MQPKIIIHFIYDFSVSVSFFGILATYPFADLQENTMLKYQIHTVVHIRFFILTAQTLYGLQLLSVTCCYPYLVSIL